MFRMNQSEIIVGEQMTRFWTSFDFASYAIQPIELHLVHTADSS